MINSHKCKILISREFNTQSSVTPTKRTSGDSLILQKRSVNQTCIQNSFTGYSSSVPTVSYSELQIILENVKQVKKKATEQIVQYQKKCAILQTNLTKAKDQIKRYENIQETITNQKSIIQEKYRFKIEQMFNEAALKQDNCTMLSDRLSELTRALEETKVYNCQLSTSLTQRTHQVDELKRKYQKIIGELNITEDWDFSNLKKQYLNLPQLFNSANTMKSTVEQQKFIIDQIRQSNQQLTNQLAQTSQIMANITTENKQLFSQISQLQMQITVLNKKVREAQEEKSEVLKQKDTTLLEIENEITRVRKDNESLMSIKQEMIGSLIVKISKLEGQISKYEEKLKNIEQQNKFKALVDEVCDEYGEYQNLLKRVQYLEKYREEYYFNVQKIQHLCKMLDF